MKINLRYLIIGLIICTILFGSLADAKPRKGGLTSGATAENSGINATSMVQPQTGNSPTDGNKATAIRTGISIVKPILASTPPTYKFVLDNCEISNTRSLHQDTDYASLAVSVNNKIAGGPKTTFMGDVNNGLHQINLEVGPIPVAVDQNTPVDIGLQIVNSGHPDYSTMITALSNSMGSLVNDFVPGAGTAAEYVVKNLGSLLDLGNCDGPVAVDKIYTNGQQLADWTANGPHTVTKYYPGTDSATGCGSNSQYKVTWHVEKVSQGGSGLRLKSTN
jgi:hypothetical protein